MFTLPDLPYDYAALEPFIDKETMVLHHDKHHATYIKNLNDALALEEEFLNMNIDELVSSLDKVPESIRTKVRNNGGGHANHSLFWQVMTAHTNDIGPEGDLAKAIDESFGGFDSFKDRFKEMALARFGSGWCWLIINNGKLEIMDTANQDSPLMEGKKPILGLDVWEHAYYLKYQNRRAEYIDNFWKIVNWDKVSELFTSV